MSRSAKVKATAQEELERMTTLTKQAAMSGGYLYPFKGILYFVSHRSLWKPLVSKLAPLVSSARDVRPPVILDPSKLAWVTVLKVQNYRHLTTLADSCNSFPWGSV